jgi:uroporphyrinogen-III synthase
MVTLAGLHVLNTRPEGQGEALDTALRGAGARVSRLPLIDIVPLPLSPEDERELLDLDRYDGVFFVSANAAHARLRCGGRVLAAVAVSACRCMRWGSGTAAVLEQAEGLSVDGAGRRPTVKGCWRLPALQSGGGAAVSGVSGSRRARVIA